MKIDNYFHFIQAVNHYLIANNLQNELFIKDRTEGYDVYKKTLLAADFNKILKAAGTDEKTVAAFAKDYNNEMNALLIFQEKALSANASMEVHNLAMITGKLGKLPMDLSHSRKKIMHMAFSTWAFVLQLVWALNLFWIKTGNTA